VLKVLQDQQVLLAQRDKRARQVIQGQLVQLGQVVQQGHKEQKVIQELKGLLVQMVHKVQRDRKDRLVTQAAQALKVRKVMRQVMLDYSMDMIQLDLLEEWVLLKLLLVLVGLQLQQIQAVENLVK
jgi:hypothetical protein